MRPGRLAQHPSNMHDLEQNQTAAAIIAGYQTLTNELANLKTGIKEIKDDAKFQNGKMEEKLTQMQEASTKLLLMVAPLLDMKEEVRKNTEWRVQMTEPINELIKNRQAHVGRFWDNIYKYGFIVMATIIGLGVVAFISNKQ